MKDYPQIARDYAEDVVSGKVLVCEYVKQACRRHLDELERQEDEDFPYYFDDRADRTKEGRVLGSASRVCFFIEDMPYTKGRWAARRKKIELQPWQVFITCVVFGWKRKKNHRRRFRVVYIEVPRKNGKTEWSAAIGDYMLVFDGMEDEEGVVEPEFGAEVYSGATTEKQAKLVFDAAKIMARRNPAFRQLGVEVMASNLSIPERNSKFEPIIGKPGDGASPSCAIVDEFHEHQSDDLYDTMLTGMGAREQPLMWVITTAGSNKAGPCFALRGNVLKMLDGSLPNDELFGIVYTLDEGDDWTSDDALIKCNPNYDVSVSGDFLKAQVRNAVQDPRKQNTTKTKHFNIWVGAKSAWMNMEKWAACADPDMSIGAFVGEPCLVGVDLASQLDISSVVLIFQKGDMHYLFSRHYLPEERVNMPGKSHYSGWLHDGYLTATDGNSIDFNLIRAELLDDFERHEIRALGYDERYMRQLAAELREEGVNAIEVRSNVSNLSEPMKHMEALVMDGKLVHDDNPVMNWMIGNVVAKQSLFNDDVYPIKEQAENKIDGAIAAITALAVRDQEDPTSVYDTRGILTL